MRVRGSYISAALIALAVIGWFVSDNFTDNSTMIDMSISHNLMCTGIQNGVTCICM